MDANNRSCELLTTVRPRPSDIKKDATRWLFSAIAGQTGRRADGQTHAVSCRLRLRRDVQEEEAEEAELEEEKTAPFFELVFRAAGLTY